MNNKQALMRIMGALFFAIIGVAAWGYGLQSSSGVGAAMFVVGVVMFAIAAGIGKPVYNRRR